MTEKTRAEALREIAADMRKGAQELEALADTLERPRPPSGVVRQHTDDCAQAGYPGHGVCDCWCHGHCPHCHPPSCMKDHTAPCSLCEQTARTEARLEALLADPRTQEAIRRKREAVWSQYREDPPIRHVPEPGVDT